MTINWLRLVALVASIASLILNGFVAITYLRRDNDPILVVVVAAIFAGCGVGFLVIVAALAP